MTSQPGTITRFVALVREHGHVVETEAWNWTAALRQEAVVAGSPAPTEMLEAIEQSLASAGAYGLLDLCLAGPTLGGMGEDHLVLLVRAIGARIAPR